MIIFSSNVWGLNNPGKAKEVQDILRGNNISVVGLVETKIKEKNASKVQKQLGNK